MRAMRYALSAISIFAFSMTASLTAGTSAALAAVPAPSAAMKFFPMRAHAQRASRTYIVKAGQSLSLISKAVYGHARWWPELYWRNLPAIHDPSTMMVYPGEHLRVPEPWRRRPAVPRAYHPAPPPAPVPASAAVTQDPPTGSAVSAGTSAPVASYGGSGVGGAFGDCVRARESGGNYQVTNSSGHYGAYQFSYPTWVAYGGSPGSFGHASPAQQDQVFANALARGGQGNWSPYDGCSPGLSTSAARNGPPSHFFGAGVAVMGDIRHWVGHRAWHALLWAKDHARGLPYVWGGSGPGGYDCSGLVMTAYARADHVQLPHNTVSMLESGMLVPARHPRPGYLAFFGSGHVELWLGPGWTFGAQKTGTLVGPHPYNSFWHPTGYFRLR